MVSALVTDIPPQSPEPRRSTSSRPRRRRRAGPPSAWQKGSCVPSRSSRKADTVLPPDSTQRGTRAPTKRASSHVEQRRPGHRSRIVRGCPRTRRRAGTLSRFPPFRGGSLWVLWTCCLGPPRAGGAMLARRAGRRPGARGRPPSAFPALSRAFAMVFVDLLLADHQRVGGHVAEALVLARGEHRDEGDEVREEAVHDAQHGPYGGGLEAGDAARVLAHDLYAEEHLAQ